MSRSQTRLMLGVFAVDVVLLVAPAARIMLLVEVIATVVEGNLKVKLLLALLVLRLEDVVLVVADTFLLLLVVGSVLAALVLVLVVLVFLGAALLDDIAL